MENPLLREKLLNKKWSPEFCPLFRDIPLLRDTLLREGTVVGNLKKKFYKTNSIIIFF